MQIANVKINTYKYRIIYLTNSLKTKNKYSYKYECIHLPYCLSRLFIRSTNRFPSNPRKIKTLHQSYDTKSKIKIFTNIATEISSHLASSCRPRLHLRSRFLFQYRDSNVLLRKSLMEATWHAGSRRNDTTNIVAIKEKEEEKEKIFDIALQLPFLNLAGLGSSSDRGSFE